MFSWGTERMDWEQMDYSPSNNCLLLSTYSIANKRAIKEVKSIIVKSHVHYDLLQSNRNHHFLKVSYDQ